MYSTPILLLIFNRPDLTERVFSVVKEMKPARLFIAADGPRDHKPGEHELCNDARSVILNNIDWPCEVTTLFRDKNLGCKIAVSSAITWFFEHVESGIILEDDTVPDKSFFSFCSEMLDKYKDNEQITQIAGFNLMGDFTEGEASYFFSKIGGIWGWASWRRVWKHYDISIKSWGTPESKDTVKRFLGSSQWFNQLKPFFDKVFLQQYDTWDYQWVYTQLNLQGMAIIPKVNLVENIGFRNDATHTKDDNSFIEKLKSHVLDVPLIHPFEFLPSMKYASFYFDMLPKTEPRYKKILRKIKGVLSKSTRA